MTVPRCTRCRGELLPEWGDYKRCPTCREEAAAQARAYRASSTGGPKARASKRAQHARNRDAYNASRREARDERQQSGICLWCPEEAAEDSNLCPSHSDKHRAASLAHYHRTKKPAVSQASPT